MSIIIGIFIEKDQDQKNIKRDLIETIIKEKIIKILINKRELIVDKMISSEAIIKNIRKVMIMI